MDKDSRGGQIRVKVSDCGNPECPSSDSYGSKKTQPRQQSFGMANDILSM